MKWAACDFEYNSSNDPNLNLVCAVVRTEKITNKYWLHRNKDGRRDLIKDLEILNKEGFVFLAYSTVAEGRSFLALGLDPLDFKWIDLHQEYRCLLNHNHHLAYGNQYVKGKIKFTKPPISKWKQTEEEAREADNSKPPHGLTGACYKLLGVQLDSGFKDAMRDLIISNPPEFTHEQKIEILDYCADDTKYLHPLLNAMIAEYKRLLGRRFNLKQLFQDMKARARYGCLSAHMEQHGYPIDVEMTRNFSDQVPAILFACQKDIMEQFPDRKPFWNLNKKTGLYAKNQKAIRVEIRAWIAESPSTRKWLMTDGGTSGNVDLSLSLKAFSRHFNYTHSYPRGNYFAQIVRYLKLTQSLNGFTTGGKTNFWDSVGSDGMVRPYMNIYGAQSSRSQPKASSFIPLKSAWMRCMIQAPKGYAMGSIDFKSQEFLIAALMSGDKAMLRDYMDGDIYLSFGKKLEFIPQDGTKAEYKKQRDMMKPIVLGIQFDMSKYGLAKDLTEKWGRKISEDLAQKFIDGHMEAYPDFWKYKAENWRQYLSRRHLRLADGFYMWGDNDNKRSAGNCPIQGMGAVIMRKAVDLCYDRGLKIPYTLHDALYMMSKTKNTKKDMITLAECMDEAFRFYFPKELKHVATVGLEADIWSKDFPDRTIKYNWSYAMDNGEHNFMEVKQQQTYIDPRGKEQYEYFKKYFDKPELEDMEF